MKPIRLSKEHIGDLGDIRAEGQYVVAPNSIHPSGNSYITIKELPIATISKKAITDAFQNLIDPTDNISGEKKEYLIDTTLRSSDYIKKCKVPDYLMNNKIKGDTSKNWKLFPYVVDILHNRQVNQEAYLNLVKMQGHKLSAIKGWVKLAYEGKLAKTSCKKMREYLERFHPELIEDICGGCDLYKGIGRDIKLIPYTAKEILKMDIEEPQWIVDGIIPEEAIVILAGASGKFKSFGSINMGFCVAKGLPWLEKFVTKTKNVLFVDGENGLKVIKQRLNLICNGFESDNEAPDNFFFFEYPPLELTHTKSMQELQDYIVENDIKLVFIDTYRRFVSFDENSAGEVSEMYRTYLQPLVNETGATIVLLHHIKKKGKFESDNELDDIRGSSDFTNMATSIITFKGSRNNRKKIVISCPKSRISEGTKPFQVNVILVDDPSGIIFEYGGELDDNKNLSEVCYDEIFEWLNVEDIKEFQTKEVMGLFKEKFGKQTIYDALGNLVKKKILRKVKRGHYKVMDGGEN